VHNSLVCIKKSIATNSHTQIIMSSAAAQYPDASPNPPVFKPKNNPAFILHGKLSTSFEEVGTNLRGIDRTDELASCTGNRAG
jgi:hypothetical protein